MSRLFEDILRKTVLLLWGAALLMVGCSESDPATEGLGAAPDGEVEFVFDLSAARAAMRARSREEAGSSKTATGSVSMYSARPRSISFLHVRTARGGRN